MTMTWDLRFPDVNAPEYHGFNGTLEQAEAAGMPIKVYKTVSARELFDKIVTQAHHNGEPGMLFLDAANRSNPVPHLYQLEATNPCGEQWLGPYENCCLGSVNLAQHLGPEAYGRLGETAPEQRRSRRSSWMMSSKPMPMSGGAPAQSSRPSARRIGLGIMGLGDLMYHVGIRYGSRKGRNLPPR